ncbi:uncharacterized protein N7515_001542 [Penicillium bovifimosum]|uniref:Uncharacterized protein n=1 Tax=Penicillium bovifimosum TaxID=126998 RepID=A0A9W9L780_9EURO|nr:uncharacterized protein N7515_001542 [Penicillium bovifimosum]KAJ5142755.1 hypothetical protein N7515_001542 [Penicillium bovifimosum]
MQFLSDQPAVASTPAALPALPALPATPLRTPLSRKAKTTHAHAHAAGKEPTPPPTDNEAAPSDDEKKGAAAATRRPRVSEMNPPPSPRRTPWRRRVRSPFTPPSSRRCSELSTLLRRSWPRRTKPARR